ncbi:MAG: hypothetical protein V1936_04665 [Patescibacteria group bacterium]
MAKNSSELEGDELVAEFARRMRELLQTRPEITAVLKRPCEYSCGHDKFEVKVNQNSQTLFVAVNDLGEFSMTGDRYQILPGCSLTRNQVLEIMKQVLQQTADLAA